jgi:hypothetical protein
MNDFDCVQETDFSQFDCEEVNDFNCDQPEAPIPTALPQTTTALPVATGGSYAPVTTDSLPAAQTGAVYSGAKELVVSLWSGILVALVL